MKSSKRVELKGMEWVNHFRIAVFPLLVAILGVLPHLESMVFPSPTIAPVDSSSFYCSGLLFLLALLLAWVCWQRLFYHSYAAQISDEQFQRALEISAQELHASADLMAPNQARLYRGPLPYDSQYERMDIFKTAERLYINSINDPEMMRKSFSVKRNQENVDVFLRNMAGILKGEEVEQQWVDRQEAEEEAFWDESEWTASKIGMRIIGYGLSLLFVGLGAFAIWSGGIEGIPIFAVIAVICSFYIRQDLKILWEKRKRKQSKGS
ncbi:MAG: hypothetical protein AAFV95_10300 [Bacteroidota bacterium]